MLWRYRGRAPAYDDGSNDPSAVTRDYTLRVDDDAGAAPVLSVFGGKITTYRQARRARDGQARSRYFPGLKPAWTDARAAAGKRFRRRSRAWRRATRSSRAIRASRRRRCAASSAATARAPTRCSATASWAKHFGAGLTERELRYFIEHEWARERRGRALAAHEVRAADDRSAARSASRRCVGR